MADIRKARPVSGEIMTAAEVEAAARKPLAGDGRDIVDADYEVVTPPEAAARPEPVRFFQQDHAGGMEMLRHASAMHEPARGPARGGPLFWMLGVALAAGAFWASGGHSLIGQAGWLDAAKGTGSQVSISGITSRIEKGGEGPVLLVEAEAVNDGVKAALLPTLEIHVTGNEGQTTRYKLGTAGEVLEAGHRFAFSSRPDVPKNGVKVVSVTFQE
jgi:hypothetical protein